MRRLLLAVALIPVLLLGACGTPAPAPTSTITAEPALELVAFAQAGFGMRGLVPEGWVELLPGIFADGSSTTGVPAVYLGWYQGASLRWVTDSLVLPRLGVEALPQPSGQVESTGLAWTLYSLEADIPGFGSIGVDAALAENAQGAGYFVLVTSSARHESLRREA